jgi:hypothetical protein
MGYHILGYYPTDTRGFHGLSGAVSTMSFVSASGELPRRASCLYWRRVVNGFGVTTSRYRVG